MLKGVTDGAVVYVCILFLIVLAPQSQTGGHLSDFILPSWLLFFTGLFGFSKNGRACELVNFQKNEWIKVLLDAAFRGFTSYLKSPRVPESVRDPGSMKLRTLGL